MTYEIAPLEPRHVPGLAELEKLCFAVPWPEQAFWEEIENPLARYSVVLCGGEIVGYAGYWHIVDEGHITNIAVHPAHRRRALASRLLDNMLAQAKAADIRLLTLEVRASNAPAIALYRKFGFCEAGVRKRYYSDNGEDAWIMTKEW